jgi:F-type H+-transporting ATPase subunit b
MEGVNTTHVILQFLNFGVLVFLLVRFGGKGIKELLRNRHLEVKKNIEEAGVLRAEAEKQLREYEAKLAGIDKEMADLLAKVRSDAEAEKRRVLAAAQEASARMRKDNELLLQQEARRLEIELRREAVLIAVEMAREILKNKITDADQQRLAQEFARRLGESKSGSMGGN